MSTLPDSMRALLLFLALAAPLASAQTPDGLVGEWRRTGSVAQVPPATGDSFPTIPEAPYRLTFDADGRLAIEAGMDVAYTFDGQRLAVRISTDGEFESIGASLDGDTLTLMDADEGTPYRYVREGDGAGIVGRWMRPGAREDGGPPVGLEFGRDGSSRVLYVATARYVAERGTLVTGDPLAMVANVRVTGDRMRLVQKGRVSTYVRATGGAVPGEAAPVVVLERTPCYGSCPEYTLAAYADGRVVWTGRRNVATLGTAEGQVAPAVVAELIVAARTAGHASLPEMLAGGDVCAQFASDMPGAVTTVRTASGVHTVTHNRGCTGFRGKAALTAFEEAIDRALGRSEWVGAAPR